MHPCARFALLAPLAIAAAIIASPARAFEVCVNGPSSYGGEIDLAAVDAVIALRPRCVRLPYRQDVWASLDDATPRGPAKLGIFATYDAAVLRYLAAGVEVYMLIHPESIAADAHVINTPLGRADWVQGATKIIDHFKPAVRRFELMNEPNNWDATQKPTNPADAFAATLADVYSAVKIAHPADRCWDVDLVSGALFAFHQSDGTGNASADYLAETYAAGIASHGWESIKQKTGSYPLDGIGWHIYMEPMDAASTASLLRSYVGQVWSTVTRYEGALSPKSIWISEFGFGTNGTASENASQAASLDNVFDALAGEPHVKMGMWFTIQDFDTAGWGLYTAGGFDAAHAKPSRARFAVQASRKVEGLWAKLAFESPRVTLAPGETVPVRVKATNLGSDTWKQSDNVRLGSGPGCPETPSANALTWIPANGFANSPTDARVFLDAADDVAPSGEKEFAFAVRAPVAPGAYRLSARMVKEGAQWFGTAAELTVIVAAPGGTDAGAIDADAGAAIGADAAQPARTAGDAGALPAATAPSGGATGCGCRVTRAGDDAARGAGVLGLLGLVVLRRRCARTIA